jgi:hypothetical protein
MAPFLKIDPEREFIDKGKVLTDNGFSIFQFNGQCRAPYRNPA